MRPNLVTGARWCLPALAILLIVCPRARAADAPPPPARVYSHLLEPREHPDYHRRAVQPPDWETFRRRTQFTTLRGFNVENDRIVGYAEELEKFTRTHGLGNVIWPSYPILFARNLDAFADELRRRDLYLFDVWGYVPGSGPGGYWQQFKPPAEAFRILEATLGERWLGTDIGEQDGRYIGGYANQLTPASLDRFGQYLNFQRHFERMGDDLGHRHTTLVSLNFGHYFLKEGTYTLIGAETAQALPNNQVYYSFIRGAGKQYGVPWFGNASVYNRWGFKTYGPAGRSDGYDFGPTKGSSLSLLKRLLYSHILYNAVAVGFENMWFQGSELSPIGRIQQSAQRWVQTNDMPGVQHTPVGLLLDFHSGWSFPRHLYSDKLFRVWGNLPYGPGDHFTDALLDLLYPGYADASYFHDESGFLTPTPYGDIADCLLSDAPLWLLRRYPVLVVAGDVAGGVELRDKLQAYAEAGGELYLTSGNLARLPGGLASLHQVTNETRVPCGEGSVTVFASASGVVARAEASIPRGEIDRPLPRPYALDPAVRRGLDTAFRRQRLFEVQGEGLSVITGRKGPGEYVLGVANNTWRPQALALKSLVGDLLAVRELPLDVAERAAPGFTPEGMDAAESSLGRNSETIIAGGDLRVFAVQVAEAGVAEIPHQTPPARPRGRLLSLRRIASLKEELLGRPTFFEHFDGVCLDWRYLHERETAALSAESGWLRRQGVRLAVDLSSGIDLYPSLRLIDNLPADYQASRATVSNVLAKMSLLGAHDLLLSLHRHPENNFSDDQSRAGFIATLREIAGAAAERDIMVHLRLAFGKPPSSLDAGLRLLDEIGAPNLKLAPATALLAAQEPSAELARRCAGRLGFWLVAAPRTDVTGTLWDAHAPVHEYPGNPEAFRRWLRLQPDLPVVADANLPDLEAEYREARALDALTSPDH